MAAIAGKAGKAGKRVFWKIGLEKLEKDSHFSGARMEKLDSYFRQISFSISFILADMGNKYFVSTCHDYYIRLSISFCFGFDHQSAW